MLIGLPGSWSLPIYAISVEAHLNTFVNDAKKYHLI